MLATYAAPVAICLYVCIRAVFLYRKTRVPGPWYVYCTSLVLKHHELSKNRRLWIHSLHKKFGPVVRLAPNEVSFADLDAMKEIYQSGGSGYDKTEFYKLFYQYGERTMFSTLSKQDHAQRKRLFADRYAMTNVMRPDMIDGIKERAIRVVDICNACHGEALDVYVTLHCYALVSVVLLASCDASWLMTNIGSAQDGASHFLFNPGGTDSLRNAEDRKIMQELSYHDSITQRYLEYYWPYFSRLPTPFSNKPFSQSRQYVQSQALAAHPHETSLIAKLRSKIPELSSLQCAAECMDHLAAGIDTTGDALCFLMHELSLPRSKHIQARLRDELQSSVEAPLDQLSYLDAVIKEGLRLFPPIPMSFPRYVPGPEGRTISDYFLPSQTIVSCQPYSLHLLNKDVWAADGHDPAIFAPERWLHDISEKDMSHLFFAFGAGGRGCIGRNLASVEMKLLLREIYTRFHTIVAPTMRGDMSIDDQIIASRPKDQTCLLLFQPCATAG
jgi:hypothetical protein